MTTTEKLAEISRIMADGFHFMILREVLEGMKTDSNQDAAVQVLEVVDRFYNLCKYVERQGE
jgi:hypothetical protein